MAYRDEAHNVFPLSKEAPRRARRWLHASGVVPSGLEDAVDLVVSELVTNSVQHSQLAEPDVVSVRVASFPGGVSGEVIDDGCGMGPAPTGDPRSIGLRLVDRTVYRWGHTDHPTRVWFEVRQARDRSAA